MKLTIVCISLVIGINLLFLGYKEDCKADLDLENQTPTLVFYGDPDPHTPHRVPEPEILSLLGLTSIYVILKRMFTVRNTILPNFDNNINIKYSKGDILYYTPLRIWVMVYSSSDFAGNTGIMYDDKYTNTSAWKLWSKPAIETILKSREELTKLTYDEPEVFKDYYKFVNKINTRKQRGITNG